MRLVLLEPMPIGFRPSSGPLLAEALGVPRVFIVDLFRAHILQRTELGLQARQLMDSGRLIPEELATAMLRDSLIRAPHAGFLLDGHPLSVDHARALDGVLDELGTPLDAAVQLRLSEQEVEFHLQDFAGRRPDIPEGLSRARLEFFTATMEPISDHYARKGLLVTVDAAGTPEQLAARAVAALREHGGAASG